MLLCQGNSLSWVDFWFRGGRPSLAPCFLVGFWPCVVVCRALFLGSSVGQKRVERKSASCSTGQTSRRNPLLHFLFESNVSKAKRNSFWIQAVGEETYQSSLPKKVNGRTPKTLPVGVARPDSAFHVWRKQSNLINERRNHEMLLCGWVAKQGSKNVRNAAWSIKATCRWPSGACRRQGKRQLHSGCSLWLNCDLKTNGILWQPIWTTRRW